MNRHSSGNRHPKRIHLNASVKRFKRKSHHAPSRAGRSLSDGCYRSSNLPLPYLGGIQSSLGFEEDRQNAQLRRQALSEAREGKHHDAIALFSELINRDPFNASHYNNRGLVYFQMSELDKAISDYNHAIKLNPSLDSVYNNRANYYACRGQLLSAILDYDIAIDLNPGNVRAWINQGITFRELQMFERAVECFDMALNFRQLEGNIYAERGRTYHLWGDWNVAIADYNQAIDCLPISADALQSVAGRLRLQVELWLDDLLGPLSLDASF
jgi:tetratricopeptide (TPR) repeat protein